MKNSVICAAFLLLLASGCDSDVRQPAVAGQFYPAQKQELSDMINKFLSAVPESKVSGELAGLLLPHAGYVFSGQVAAYGAKLLEGKKYDTVILVGPSHNVWLKKAAVDTEDAYSTPLGEVPVDIPIAREIIGTGGLFEENNKAHAPEHSLEVQLPFLQSTMKGFRIVPVLVGQFDIEKYRAIAAAIDSVVKKHGERKFLYVISSDMSHYPSWKDANRVDGRILGALGKYDPEFFKQEADRLLSEGRANLVCVFCGEGAVITGMYLTKALGADKVNVLRYANSGDTGTDKDRVVGYCAAAFTGAKLSGTGKSGGAESAAKGDKSMVEFSVRPENQKILLGLARNAIAERLRSKGVPAYETKDAELNTPAAVFVTLTEKGQLRGCIGTTTPRMPLYSAVQTLALSAGFDDFRFAPVSAKELKDIKIEISVLSPLKRAASADEIKQGVHGVTVSRDGRFGLFLPQVWEQIPKKEDFLGELCSQKAGLARDAWKDPGTELSVFTVFAFKE